MKAFYFLLSLLSFGLALATICVGMHYFSNPVESFFAGKCCVVLALGLAFCLGGCFFYLKTKKAGRRSLDPNPGPTYQS